MYTFIINSPLVSGLIIGLSILLLRIFILPLFLKHNDFLSERLYFKNLIDILNLGHSLVLYDVSSDGKNLQERDSTAIKNPLRIEDDIIAKKTIPFIFFDPKTLKVKGHFHALSPDSFKNKYAETIYEGHLVLVASGEDEKK
ncbi:hypothetical protein [Acinetobacter sp. TGL-Y2]|uniref:hypothetical protein n=1 Tax=Acinetobacter sp. TGL-Y2 TaxID=1407071 RepID=UPI000AF35C3B|nr:hypothetical protein [Acinetobacter sp. TGL-Y2]